MVAGHAHFCHASKGAVLTRCRKPCITTLAFNVVLHCLDGQDEVEQQIIFSFLLAVFFFCIRVAHLHMFLKSTGARGLGMCVTESLWVRATIARLDRQTVPSF